jgi:DNA-binding NarL/FixJ family response regulator
MPRGRPRRPVEPFVELLLEGKVPKQIGAAFGVCNSAVDYHLRRWVKEQGCKTLIQAVALYAKKK